MTRSRSSRQNWTFLCFVLFGCALAFLGLSQTPSPSGTEISRNPVASFPTALPSPLNLTQSAPSSPVIAPPIVSSAAADAATTTATKTSGTMANKNPVPDPSVSNPSVPNPALTNYPVATNPINPVAANPMVVNSAQPLVGAAVPLAVPLPAARYGHLPYAEAPQGELAAVGQYSGRSEFLHQDAAIAFEQMQQAAAGAGVELVPISGFRDLAVQADLFDAQISRRGSAVAAATISAPPGYSEHHTGYAIDLGDAQHPETDLEIAFEQTPGFAWMSQNASRYGFELSFPKGNGQGVSYEPWHWRFVMSPRASQIFAYAP